MSRIVYLDKARVIEHVFSSTFDDRSITGNEAVGSQHLQTISSQRDIASKQSILLSKAF